MNTYISRTLFVVSMTAGLSLQAGLVSFSPTTAGLINTGVNLAGVEDQSWSVLPGFDPAVVVSPTHANWIPNDGTSQWIWQTRDSSTDISNVSVAFALSFDLPTSYDPASTTVLGQWAVDNEASMFLNGNLVTTAQNTFGGNSGSFGAVNDFSISDYFVAGPNVLKIELDNLSGESWSQNPSGLNVRFEDLQTSVIPEPSALLFALTGGILGLLTIRRRR